MIKTFLQTLFIVCSIFVSAQSKINYDDYFQDGSLRIDFLLYGKHEESNVSIYQLKKQRYYGAKSSAQLFGLDAGNYRLQIRDKASGTLIFSKGFNPIFSEWQAMPEAKNKVRAFENSQLIPMPKYEIEVEIQHRHKRADFVPIYKGKISPDDYNIIAENPTPYPVVHLLQNGDPKNKVDIAIIAEGYTQEEMQKFLSDAQRMMNYMFEVEPFKHRKNDFNVTVILTPSQESGTDIPGEGIYKNTALNSRFYTFGQERYLTTVSDFKISDIAAQVPYDQLFIIVNTPRYGGGGLYNVINLVSADHQQSDIVFVHEFGHGFAALADEYYNAGMGGDSIYPLHIEPWEKNITTLVDFDRKWKKLIHKNTPIPTPRTPQFQNVLGAFEGGGYLEKGVYSPVQDCRMKTNDTPNFCPVCSNAIEEMIDFHTR